MPNGSSAITRLPIGQLLVSHVRVFRERLLAEAERQIDDAGLTFRMAHMHVFANIGAGGTRLTDLAVLAGMTRPSMAELIDELENQGLLERRPDPRDSRAKLVVLTARGRDVVRAARAIITRIEADYASRIGRQRYEAMCQSMQDLLDDLNDAKQSGNMVTQTTGRPPSDLRSSARP
jgi:DNA-binding MarR family transcriptional regulator